MSVTANYAGNLERIFSKALTDTTKVIVGTVIPDNSMTAAGWWACNDTASPIIVQLYYFSLLDSAEYLIWTKSVPANDTIGSADTPIRLRQGDEIRVKGANGLTMNVTVIINLSANR